MKKKKYKLPKKILPMPNKDKTFQESWYNGRDLLDFPHSWRCVISGRVGAGKTTIVKNLIIRQDPMFQKIFVVHIDPDSEDYAEVEGVQMIDFIPGPRHEFFKGKKKTLIILDDLEYKFMSKEQLRNLDRLYGYVSSHKGVSCAVLSQDVYNIPVCIRRMSNIWILGKINNDLTSFLTIAERCGVKREDFVHIYETYIKGNHDSFWLDRTEGSPAQFRINGYTILDKSNNYAIKK